MADDKDMAVMLGTITEALINEHGYKQQRDGHDSSSCQTCQNISCALVYCAAAGVLDDDDEPSYNDSSPEELRNLLAEHEPAGTDELDDDEVRDALKAFYSERRRRGYYNWS